MFAKKILICDDNEGILDMLTLVLEDDFNVIAERNSLNVYRLIEKEKPDLIVLDLWMPVLSGDLILKHLKKNPDFAGIPVLIISASADGRSISLDAGADDYLEKPFDVDLFQEIITRRLALR